MRIVRRVPTVKEQTDHAWRVQDRWTREVVRELLRLGHDPDPQVKASSSPDSDGFGRVYFTGVGARNLTVVVRTAEKTGQVVRVTIGRESFTARRAALWLRKRAPREKRYLT